MGAPEAYVENYLVTQCKKRHIICWKLSCPGTTGVPDRIVLHAGQTVYIETKRKGGKTRKLQDVRIKQIRESGNWVEVADTRQDIDRILNELEAHTTNERNQHE